MPTELPKIEKKKTQFSIDTNSATQTLSPHFLHHQCQDYLLVAWLLASMSPTMLN